MEDEVKTKKGDTHSIPANILTIRQKEKKGEGSRHLRQLQKLLQLSFLHLVLQINQGLEEDPRIKVMKKDWFEGKACLDIGCNSGLITFTIAKKFGCRKILGIDIDSGRIEDAYWSLRRTVKIDERKKHPKDHKLVADGVNESPNEGTNGISGDSPASGLFDIVSFQKYNFVQGWSSPGEKLYDTILCLSVSKWIHLNWGDDGLITLFAKIWRLLQPGGFFILEPQPWKSYVSNRQVSEVAATNYKNIETFPDRFQEILVDKIRFRKILNWI